MELFIMERKGYVESISGYRKYTRWILSMSLGFQWSYFSGPFQLSDLWAPFPYLLKDHLFHSTNYKNRHGSWSGCLCSEPGCKAESPGHSTGRNEEWEHDKGHRALQQNRDGLKYYADLLYLTYDCWEFRWVSFSSLRDKGGSSITK